MNVHICSNVFDTNKCIELIRNSGNVVFGFDTETTVERMADKCKTSVIQLYDGTDYFIFQIYRMWKSDGEIPQSLVKFMKNAQWIKVGVAADNDSHQLAEHYDIKCRGVIDVQYIATSLGMSSVGMDDLVKIYQCPMQKESKKSIYTNWDIDLNQRHISYACVDAYISLYILNFTPMYFQLLCI